MTEKAYNGYIDQSPLTPHDARMAVATWLRLKFATETFDNKLYRDACGDRYEAVVYQLQMDAMHSALLMRLLSGEQPKDGDAA